MLRGIGLVFALLVIFFPTRQARALSQFDVELMLIWTGHLTVEAGRATEAQRLEAVRAFQKSIGVRQGGELSKSDLSLLQERSDNFRRSANFSILLDTNTGIRLGLPLAVVAKSSQTKTVRGSEWKDGDRSIVVATMLIPTEEASLAVFYRNMRAMPKRNFTFPPKDKTELGGQEDRFTIEGDFGTRRFHIHARTDGKEIRAFQFSYPEDKAGTLDRVAHAMASSFDPFPVAQAFVQYPGTHIEAFHATEETNPSEQVKDFRKQKLKEERAALAQGKAKIQRRIAFVLANAAYVNAPRLRNAVNDAEDIASELTRLGFSVIKGVDRTKQDTMVLLQSFANALDKSDVALFFYSGHGLQIGGKNYLVPVEAMIERERDVVFQAIPVDFVIEQMENSAPTNLVFLDACRDNPFSRNLSTSVSRSFTGRPVLVQRGLAEVMPGSGTFIAFSTSPNQVASDGEGRNSPFTGALKRHIATPDISVSDLMIKVRVDVLAETGRRQRPWDQSALEGIYYFAGTRAPERQ